MEHHTLSFKHYNHNRYVLLFTSLKSYVVFFVFLNIFALILKFESAEKQKTEIGTVVWNATDNIFKNSFFKANFVALSHGNSLYFQSVSYSIQSQYVTYLQLLHYMKCKYSTVAVLCISLYPFLQNVSIVHFFFPSFWISSWIYNEVLRI